MKKLFYLLIVLFIYSCSEDKVTENFGIRQELPSLETEKEQSLSKFATILSKVVYESKEAREFLKAEALKRIDNDYNVFYPLVQNRLLSTGVTLRDLLIKYSCLSDIELIERNLPLLNIHIPEITSVKVDDFETDNNEIPVYHARRLYLNGIEVDALDADEIPDFNIFSVGESGSIRKAQSKKSELSDLSINSDYEYIHPTFSPAHTKHVVQKKTEGLEDLTNKYKEAGLVPKGDIDPLLIKAYENSITNRRATRGMVYYGMNSPNATPGNLRSDISDCIFRFKIAGNAFERIDQIASANGSKPLLNGGSTSNKIHELSREQVISRFLTGRSFCFMFRIEGYINGSIVTSEGMKVYVSPEQLFNLYIDKSRRHPTWFRKTLYTYSINKAKIDSKWYYPMDHGHDTRLDKWDISSQPVTKRFSVHVINPDEGTTQDITDKYTVSYITKNDASIDISGNIKEIFKVGIKGGSSSTTTETREVTTKYTIPQQNMKLDEFTFHFFDDFPIVTIDNSGQYIIPVRKGKGIIETSILPISVDFFTYQRFLK